LNAFATLQKRETIQIYLLNNVFIKMLINGFSNEK